MVGETVTHRVFGKGMIVSLRPMGNDVLMEIAFEKVDTKKIMQNMDLYFIMMQLTIQEMDIVLLQQYGITLKQF